MAVVRSNIVTNPTVAQQFIQGVSLLKQEFLGPLTTDFAIPGSAQQVSTWGLFNKRVTRGKANVNNRTSYGVGQVLKEGGGYPPRGRSLQVWI